MVSDDQKMLMCDAGSQGLQPAQIVARLHTNAVRAQFKDQKSPLVGHPVQFRRLTLKGNGFATVSQVPAKVLNEKRSEISVLKALF